MGPESILVYGLVWWRMESRVWFLQPQPTTVCYISWLKVAINKMFDFLWNSFQVTGQWLLLLSREVKLIKRFENIEKIELETCVKIHNSLCQATYLNTNSVTTHEWEDIKSAKKGLPPLEKSPLLTSIISTTMCLKHGPSLDPFLRRTLSTYAYS